MAINELFSNITWTLGQAEDLDDEAILSHWRHPMTNIYITLVLFIIMNFLMAVFSNTLPIPAGVFVPVFTIGAAFGRLVGESMAAWFPEGIPSGDIVRKIVPGGYAVVGAASLSGSVTRTISTAVIVFEITGQISHVLPAVISVLISNAVANVLQPSFYDSIIKLKKLPYLPDIVSTKSNAWLLYVEDFMTEKVDFIAFGSTYQKLQDLLINTKHRSYPLVDSVDSKILLGSIQRCELERILLLHLNHEKKVMWSERHRIAPPVRFEPASPVPEECIDEEDAKRKKDTPDTPAPKAGASPFRFQVTKVDETDGGAKAAAASRKAAGAQQGAAGGGDIPMQLLSVPQAKIQPGNSEDSQYNTIHVPLRSILKKSSSTPQMSRARSTGDLRAEVNNFYRKIAKQHKDSIVEDLPFIINKDSMQNLYKKVKLPWEPAPTKISHLPLEDQEAWEQRQLSVTIDWEGVQIDPAPFQLVERTSLHKVHSLFSLLGLSHAFVTNTGRLAGVVGLRELRNAVQGQIELQEKGSFKVSSSSVRDEEDLSPSEEEEAAAPIDSANLEVDKDTPKPHFRLKSVRPKENDVETET